jgi:hypothetical protein
MMIFLRMMRRRIKEDFCGGVGLLKKILPPEKGLPTPLIVASSHTRIETRIYSIFLLK